MEATVLYLALIHTNFEYYWHKQFKVSHDVVHVEKPSQRTRRSRQISDLGLQTLPIWALAKIHWIRDGMVLLCDGPLYQHWLIVKNKSLWDGTFPSSRPNSKTLILIFEKLKCFNDCHFCFSVSAREFLLCHVINAHGVLLLIVTKRLGSSTALPESRSAGNPEHPPDLRSTYFRGLVDDLDCLLNVILEAITKRDKVV